MGDTEKYKSIVYPVDTISKFIELSIRFSRHRKVIFRGQTRDWPLIPSVGRKKFGSDILKNEEKILDDFKREAVPYLNIKPENTWQWLALAQHNGLPTRLLDWTKNPLVALWFAVKDVSTRYLPRIVWAYIYDDEDICRCASPFDIDDIKKTCIYFPEHVFPFIQAQSGIFTAHPKTKEHPMSFPPFEVKYADLHLKKIEILPKFVTVIRAKLGIHSATMFPGLDGIADRIKYENELREDEGETFKVKKQYAKRKSGRHLQSNG